MKAQIVPAVILTEDDGRVTNIFFSQTTADLFLGIMEEYAKNDTDGDGKKQQEIQEARAVAQSAEFPKETTPADRHYCDVSSVAEALHLTEEQLLRRGDNAVPKEWYPGYALCCFVRGGRHGLRLAFSRQAAKQLYDEPVPAPYSNPLLPYQVEALKGMIDSMALPFPKDCTQLDDELGTMLASLRKVHR